MYLRLIVLFKKRGEKKSLDPYHIIILDGKQPLLTKWSVNSPRFSAVALYETCERSSLFASFVREEEKHFLSYRLLMTSI